MSQYKKGKTNLDLLEQEIVSGSGSGSACRTYNNVVAQLSLRVLTKEFAPMVPYKQTQGMLCMRSD